MLLKKWTHVTFIDQVEGNSSNPVWRKTLSKKMGVAIAQAVAWPPPLASGHPHLVEWRWPSHPLVLKGMAKTTSSRYRGWQTRRWPKPPHIYIHLYFVFLFFY
jgi:hypothetical protein